MRTDDSTALFKFFRSITHISQTMTLRAERQLPDGLTIPQFELIDLLKARASPVLPMEAAITMNLTRGAVSNLIKQLEKKNLLEVMANPDDGRSKRITLSDQGQKSHRDCMIALSEVTTNILQVFSGQKFAAVQNMLDEFSDWLDNASIRDDSEY